MKQFPVSCVTKYMYLFIKKYSYALKVQIMIEMYICTSRFDNLRQAIIYYKRMIKIKVKQLVFLPFY